MLLKSIDFKAVGFSYLLDFIDIDILLWIVVGRVKHHNDSSLSGNFKDPLYGFRQ